MSGIKEDIEQLAREAAQRRKEEIVDGVIRVQAAHFERATAYTNIIIAGGCAGAFAVWSFVGDVLSSTQRAWTALLLLISILVFVMWEVTKMILLGVQGQQFSRLVSSDPMKTQQLLDEHVKTIVRLEHRLNAIVWARVVLPIAIGAALGAAGILGYAFVRQIVFG